MIPAVIEFACLGMVVEHPCTGYDIMMAVRSGNLNPLRASSAAIYAALRRLEAAETVDRQKHPQVGRPSRLVYSANASSRDHMKDLASSIVRRHGGEAVTLLLFRFYEQLPTDLVGRALLVAMTEVDRRALALDLGWCSAPHPETLLESMRTVLEARASYLRTAEQIAGAT